MGIKLSACCVTAALALTTMVSSVRADQWNKETRVTVNQPMEVPGTVLGPGTYVFKLVDRVSDRNTVQIFSVDARGRQKLVTTILAISAYGLQTPDKPVIRLEERRAGEPEAIHSWFYPGDNAGSEFVFPKSERLEVAAVEVPIELPEPPAAPEPTAALEPAPTVQAEETSAFTAEETSVVIPDTSTDRIETLPETAGNSTSGLIGGATLLGAGILVVFAGLRRRTA